MTGESFETLRSLVEAYFEATKKPPPYKRRPQLSLSIPAHGEGLPGRVVLRPTWSKPIFTGDGKVNCQKVRVELLVQKPCENGVFGMTVKKPDGNLWHRPELQLVLSLEPGKWSWCRRSTKLEQYEADLARVHTTAENFISDPIKAFTYGAADHCGLCGKALSDEISRSRGVGPECQAKLEFFYQVDWLSPKMAGIAAR